MNVATADSTGAGTTLTTWASTLCLTQPAAKYYWRVLPNNTSCSGDWSNIRNFTVKYLPKPILVNPISNEVVCTFSFDNYDTRDNELFTWSSIMNSERYDIEIDKDKAYPMDRAFAVPVDSPQLADQDEILNGNATIVSGDTTALITTLSNGTYHWRVRGWKSECPGGGNWSDWGDFVVNNVQDNTVVHGSREVTRNFPADGDIDCDNNSTFSWQAQYGATAYQFQISDDIGFGSFKVNTSIAATSTTWAPGNWNFSGIYYWRVMPYNANCTGDWTSGWKIIYDQMPPFALLTPIDNTKLCNLNSTDQDDTPVLTWDPSSTVVPAASITYTVQLDNDNDYDFNASDCEGAGCPYCCGWGCGSLCYSDDLSAPFHLFINTTVVNVTTYDVSSSGKIIPPAHGAPVPANHTINKTKWRVIASDGTCNSPWTGIWTLDNRTPYMNPNSYDSYNSTNLRWCNSNDHIDLNWNNNSPWVDGVNVYNAEKWDIEFYLNDGTGSYGPGDGAIPGSTVGALIWSTAGVVTTNYTYSFVPPLTDAGENTYYWRVTGYNNDCQEKNWSNFRKVIIETIETPTQIYPINKQFICYPPNPTLTWDKVFGAPETGTVKYRINTQCTKCHDYPNGWKDHFWDWDSWSASPVPPESVIPGHPEQTGVVFPISQYRLPASGYYRWQVRAETTDCLSGWSALEEMRVLDTRYPPTLSTQCFAGNDTQQVLGWTAPPFTNAYQIEVLNYYTNQVVVGAGGTFYNQDLYSPANTNGSGGPQYPGIAGDELNWINYQYALGSLGNDLNGRPGLPCGTYKVRVRGTHYTDRVTSAACFPPVAGTPLGVCGWSDCWTDWSSYVTIYVQKADYVNSYHVRLQNSGVDIPTSGGTHINCSKTPNVVWDDARCSTVAPIDDAGFPYYDIQISRNSSFSSIWSWTTHNVNSMPLEWPISLPDIVDNTGNNNCTDYYIRIRMEGSCTTGSYPLWSPTYKFDDMHLFVTTPIVNDAYQDAGASGHVCITNPNFKWNWACSAKLFDLEVSHTPTFTDDANMTVYQRTSFPGNEINWAASGRPNLQHLETYYWHVKPRNSMTSCTSSWGSNMAIPSIANAYTSI